MNKIKTVSFIGSGNMATNLAKAFFDGGIVVQEVFSRSIQNANLLAIKVNAKGIDNIANFLNQSDLVVIALKDDVILSVLNELTIKPKFLVHTSGSFDTEKLRFYSHNYGCFYPFQTVRKEFYVDLLNVNLFVETNKLQYEATLIEFAKQFSNNVILMNSPKRKSLHIAGIMLNNFTHYILSATKEYCEVNSINPDYLKPLLTQTIQNSFYTNNSTSILTGPARRGDVSVIKEHLEELGDKPKQEKIYKVISQLILDEFYEDKIKL